MRQIRNNVFETNSSSTHSVSVSYKNSNYYSNDCLEDHIDYNDNKVHVNFGEFGWEMASYDHPYEKLQYIVTMLVETEGRNILSVDDLFETEGFKLINDAVAYYCNCNGICIDDEMKMKYYEWDGKKHFYLDHEGYIDHQSHENYKCVQDFLDDYGVSAEKFIFDNGVCVITDNDNH